MNILLTNDDGIHAEGLKVLSAALSKKHRVFIVAPKTNKSGASCQMSVALPLELKNVQKENCVLSYHLEGSPVDCVLSGLNGSYIPEKIDAVVSGINDGPNLGTDIIYSGTCGAARQACLAGIPGIALSIDTDSRDPADKSGLLYFENLADFAAENIDSLISLCGKLSALHPLHSYYRFFVNVNAPAVSKYKGARLTVPSIRRYKEDVQLKESENGAFSSVCGSEYRVYSYGGDLSDFKACNDGFVSVSVIGTEPGFSEVDKIKDFLNCEFRV
ncbi:5'/3'-nucleotidase SurE [Treponema sp.]|uniref:5'/3'-nucleotidase SurE n=1 Tax=Treponema sp. TaxID=166 RepID=UPI003F025FC8